MKSFRINGREVRAKIVLKETFKVLIQNTYMIVSLVDNYDNDTLIAKRVEFSKELPDFIYSKFI